MSFTILASALFLGAVWPGSYWALGLASFLYAIGALRLYSISHDCGHYSYVTNRRANDVLGRVLGIFTGNTHSAMQYNHNLHHANLGDLNCRADHEIYTMTLREYNAASFKRRLLYRIYRSPFTLFVLGPIWTYFIRYRWPRNAHKVPLRDIAFQNVAMAIYWGLVAWLLGAWALLVVILGSYLGGSFGIFVVYVGHNFEKAYWEMSQNLNQQEAALSGASILDLGWLPNFALMNFGFHDLHHLNSRIPSYRLKKCHETLSSMLNPTRITYEEAWRSLHWRLWDEGSGRMVPFPRRTSFLWRGFTSKHSDI